MRVEKRASNYGNGLFALDDFKQGAAFAQFETCLTAQSFVLEQIKTNGRLLPFLSKFVDSVGCCAPEDVFLTIFIAAVRTSPAQYRDSPHVAYITSLPDGQATGVWPETTVDGTTLGKAIVRKQFDVDRAFEVISRAGLDQICSLGMWRWASGIVQSRTIILPTLDPAVDHTKGLDKAGKTLLNKLSLNKQPLCGLVPMLDLCNHAGEKANARWEAAIAQQKLVFKLIALRDIAKGAEITVSYGNDKSNIELLFDYGFKMPKNPVVSSRVGLDTKGRGQIDQYITIKVNLEDNPRADKYGIDAPGLFGLDEYWGCVTQDWKPLLALYIRNTSSEGLEFQQWLLDDHTNKAWRGHMDTCAVAAILYGHVKNQHQRLQAGLAQLAASESKADYEYAAEIIGEECACLNHALEHIQRMKLMSLQLGSFLNLGR